MCPGASPVRRTGKGLDFLVPVTPPHGWICVWTKPRSGALTGWKGNRVAYWGGPSALPTRRLWTGGPRTPLRSECTCVWPLPRRGGKCVPVNRVGVCCSIMCLFQQKGKQWSLHTCLIHTWTCSLRIADDSFHPYIPEHALPHSKDILHKSVVTAEKLTVVVSRMSQNVCF